MAELFAIGQIIGAEHFPNPTLFCKWGIHAGKWIMITTRVLKQ